MTKNLDFTYAGFHRRLTIGQDPRLLGTSDGKANYPLPDSTEPAAFQRELFARARNEANVIATVLQHQTQHFVDFVDNNPFSLAGSDPVERSRTISHSVINTVEEDVADRRQELGDARELTLDRRGQRAIDYERAGGDPPADRLPTLRRLLLTTVSLCGLEGLGAFALLAGTIEPVQAFVSGLAIPAVMTILGGVAGFLGLRPADKQHRRGAKRIAKLTGAVASGIAAATITIFVAAWRTTLIGGHDGNDADIVAVLQHWWQLFSYWETWALAVVSLAAFFLAGHEVDAFFGGFVPSLRASDEAYRQADIDRLAKRDQAFFAIEQECGSGTDEINNLVRVAAEWAKGTKMEALRLRGAILEANRSLDNLQNAVLAIDAEYRAANERTRSQPVPIWEPLPAVGQPFAVPEVIDEAPTVAARNSAIWAEGAREETTRIGTAELDALAYIESLVDLSTRTMPRPPIPIPALPWRATA